jgi:uncharacterized protein (TIGR03437 family)
MNRARIAVLLSCCCLPAVPAFAQTITGGTCAASNLTGTYSLTLSGRAISAAGSLTGTFQGDGLATFDGISKVTFTGTVNTNLASGKPFTYSGTYTVPSNCFGTVTLNTGSTATFTLVVWSSGTQYDITGSDSTYVYSGSGSSNQPAACAAATLSGEFTYDATGSTLSGTAVTGSADESGELQFDGQGNVTSSYTVTSSLTTPAAITATGTYSVTSTCLATATLTDSTGKIDTLNFVIEGNYGDNLVLVESNSAFVRSGSGHSAFLNPARSIANVASYSVNATPPGSVFVLYGTGLATANKSASATSTPLPTTLLTTTVKVNGTPVPLFYAASGQIDAQMPWNIPGNSVASVIVTFGTTTSNAAAVVVPATGTPGISVYSNNRAVVVNADGNVNSSTDAASVGDEVVVYFTGGGPVTTSGTLVTGSPAPDSLSPVPAASNPTITVGGINATVKYIGLTPLGIGLYQANFLVPQIAKGTYPVVITISGQASNALGGPTPNPVMTVAN